MSNQVLPYHRAKRWARLRHGISEEVRTYLAERKRLPDCKFLIFAQGRTGSSLLTTLLSTSPNVHCDREIYYSPRVLPYTFARKRERQFGTEAYGFKVKVYQIRPMARKEPNAFLDHFEKNGYRIIYLKRRNVVLQSFSNDFARRTRQFHFAPGEARPEIRFPVDTEWFLKLCRKRRDNQLLEEAYLKGRTLLRLVYEDDLLTGYGGLRDTGKRISDYLGIPINLGDVPIRKSVNKAPAEFIANIDDLESALMQSEFADLAGTLHQEATGA